MPERAVDVLVPPPSSGRVFEADRLVRFGDLSPRGRLRLDALGRYLQDVSADDTADAGYHDLVPWVVRRLTIETRVDAVFRERLTLCTWCSGTGGRWAERRVSIVGDQHARLEATVLWVHIDVESGTPRKLTDDFFAHYGEAAAGRKVSARLHHDPTVASNAERRSWPLRFTDFDPLRHVNNSVYLAAVEDAMARRPDLRAPHRVEVEYRAGIEQGADVVLATLDEPAGTLALWLVDDTAGTVFATARVEPLV